MNRKQFWSIENVDSFKGHNVVNGEIDLDDGDYADHLDEVYGDVRVCGQKFGSGSLLKDADPTAFRCGKHDYASQLDEELRERLDREDSDDIEFIDGDEFELDEEENEE